MSAKHRGVALKRVERAFDPPAQDPDLKVQVHHDVSSETPDDGVQYLQCAKCLDEWRESFQGTTSPKGYARQQAALTRDGVQVWCTRHEINITKMVLRAVRKEVV